LDQKEAFDSARRSASQLMAALIKLKQAFPDEKKANRVHNYVPRAQQAVHEIEALLKKAEKDL
jgi:hypothetical protein